MKFVHMKTKMSTTLVKVMSNTRINQKVLQEVMFNVVEHYIKEKI